MKNKSNIKNALAGVINPITIFFLKRKLYQLHIKEAVLQNLLKTGAQEYKEGRISQEYWHLKQRYYTARLEQCKREYTSAEEILNRKFHWREKKEEKEGEKVGIVFDPLLQGIVLGVERQEAMRENRIRAQSWGGEHK